MARASHGIKVAVKSFNTHFRFLVYILESDLFKPRTANQQSASPARCRKSYGQTQRRWSSRFARISIIGQGTRQLTIGKDARGKDARI